MVSMDPEAIYRNFTSEAHGTGGLSAARDTVSELGKGAVENAESLRDMANSVAAGWTGAAADGAGQALTPLVRDLTEFATELETTQDLIARQVDSFHATANRVTPMPPRPVLPDVAGMVVAGESPTSMLEQVHGYQAAANNNVDAMTSYQNDSSYNTENLPPMSPDLATTIPGPTTSATPNVTITARGVSAKPAATSDSYAPNQSPPQSQTQTQLPPQSAQPAASGTTATSGTSPASGTAPTSSTNPASGAGLASGTSRSTGSGSGPVSGTASETAPAAAAAAMASPASAAALAAERADGRAPRTGFATSPLTVAQGIRATEPPDAAPPESGIAEAADQPVETAGGRQRGSGGGAVPVGGIAGQPVDSGDDAEHLRKYNYGEGAGELFLGGLPETASSILDADLAE